MDDGTLVRQACEGQVSAYETLVRRWSARVTGYVRSRVGSPQAAEDLAQDSLLKAYQALPTLSDPNKFGSWLLSIAHRSAIDWLRSKSRTEVRFVDLAHGDQRDNQQSVNGRWAAPDIGPDQIAAQQEQARQLLRHVGELPESQRETLLIYYYDNVTYQQLADMLGVSTATINARLTKARKTLREKMMPPKVESPEEVQRSKR